MLTTKKWFIILLLPFLAACGNQENQLDNQLAIPVSVVDVKSQSIVQYINTTGTTKATQEATLTSDVAGKYFLLRNPKTRQPFKLGDVVQKGTVIARFEDKEYVNSIALEIKKLNFEIAELEYQKQQSLYKKGGVTFREMKNSEVSLSQARSDFENAKIKLEKMDVVAPFKGVIVELPDYTNGTVVAVNSNIVTLMDYATLLMEVNLPEKSMAVVKTGQRVGITNYALPKDTLKATIRELSPVVSSETRTYQGKLLIDNPEGKLRPGMFVKADIETARKDSAIVIPKSIILSGNRGKTVFIVQKGAAQQRTISTGLENEREVEVVSGLKKNDRLVIKGYETLRNRSKVKVVK